MNSRTAAVFLSAAALLGGCSGSGPEKLKAELVAADKAFCAASLRDGPKAAFLGVITAEAKLLGDRRLGAEAVAGIFGRLPPSATLSWDPAFADVSASGDLGYTWGRYTLTIPNPKKGIPPWIRTGYYVTVWKKQPNGVWKVVLDGGNPEGPQ